jgi:hypothetical protein
VDDAPVLLKLRNGVHLFSRSEKQNGFQQKPGSPKSSSMVAMEGPHEKNGGGVRRVFVIGDDRTSGKRLGQLFCQ